MSTLVRKHFQTQVILGSFRENAAYRDFPPPLRQAPGSALRSDNSSWAVAFYLNFYYFVKSIDIA